MTVTGMAQGSDGAIIKNFSVQVSNSSDEIILNQSFDNGSFTLDAIPGYNYWFSGAPIYGGVLVDGSQLVNGSVVKIPINFPYGAPDNAKKIFIFASIILVSITLYHEAKKSSRKR